MANINAQFEGTRFATDVAIYDPSDGEIITSLATVAQNSLTPAVDVADAVVDPDATDVGTQFNALLASLRNAGILE